MLTSIREKATGWIAWTIVILITIPFALWGVNSYFTYGPNASVAEFSGGEIDYQTYQNALNRERNRLRQVNGQNLNPESLSGSVLGPAVINGLVSQLLLIQDADRQGYRISDEQLLEAILAEESFQAEDGFSQELYERMLRFSGYSPAEFEAAQKNNAAIQQMQTGFFESTLQIKSDVDDILSLLQQQRYGQYALIESSRFIPEIRINSEEIEDYYDRNKRLFQEAEKIKVQYIELSLADFAQNYDPTEATLRNIYEAESAAFQKEEQRSVSHILLDSENEYMAAELVEQLRAGESFESLVQQHSVDVGTAQSGGSIGWVNRGVTEPEFEAVAFTLQVGQISDPIQSSFGTHIIRVDEISAGDLKEFDEVREEIRTTAIQNQAEAEMFNVSEELRNIAYEQPDSLEPAAEHLGMSLQVSDWFRRSNGTGIGEHSLVRNAAFSDEVVNQQYNSDVIDLPGGTQIVLRKVDYQGAQQLDLEQVEAQITEQLLLTKSLESAESLAEELTNKLNSGSDWNEILAENGLNALDLPTSVEDVSDPVVRQVVGYVFKAGKPSLRGDVYGRGRIGVEQYSIFRITDVVNGDGTQVSDQDVAQVQEILKFRFGNELFQNYVEALSRSADVDINEQLIFELDQELL